MGERVFWASLVQPAVQKAYYKRGMVFVTKAQGGANRDSPAISNAEISKKDCKL